MFKKIVFRGLIGFPLGIAISYIITIGISLAIGGGNYFACPPVLADQFGSEIIAVVLQALLSGVLGATFAAASIIWEIEHWSIAKQTGTYFFIGSLAMLPIAYLNHWMDHSMIGVVSYMLVYLIIFVFIWFTMRFVWRNKIRQVNERINIKNKAE